jgi:CRISP-associated protein Cas1
LKIANQAALLAYLGRDDTPVSYLIKKVRSGDPDNVEATAARRYWPLLLGEDFRREREGMSPNASLNYGYAILRSCATRMLVATGLHPGIGVHHQNKYNAFGLADDIMEPFRPWVDRIVWSLHVEQGLDTTELDTAMKKELLEVLQHDVQFGAEIRPLASAMRNFAVEIGNFMAGKIERLTPVKLISLNYEENTWNGFEMDG